MPCRYVIDKHRRLVTTTAWERISFSEARAHQDQLSKDPDFSPSFDQLLDATAVTAVDMSAQEIRELTRRYIFSPQSRRAFVASQPVVFGIGRMMQSYLEVAKPGALPGNVNVFYDLNSALKWLEGKTDSFSATPGKP